MKRTIELLDMYKEELPWPEDTPEEHKEHFVPPTDLVIIVELNGRPMKFRASMIDLLAEYRDFKDLNST